MAKLFATLSLALLIAACDSGVTPQEQSAADARDIAAVEASQTAPAIPVDPQPIGYPDMEKHGIYGASCAFAPEGGGLGAVAISMADVGYMKINGTMLRFAPDVGSDEQQLGTRVKYDGRKYSYSLRIDESRSARSGYETTSYKAELLVRDSADRQVYKASGSAQCGV